MRKTCESLSAGHPDKICDQIADALVDECLRRDPQARVNFRVLGSHGMLVIAGEWMSIADFDLAAVARSVYADTGYKDEIEVFVNVEREEKGSSTGTAIVSGYATRETREQLPRPLVFAHALAKRLDDVRTTDLKFSWLKPEASVQVCMEKDSVRAVTILASHVPEIDSREVKLSLIDRIVTPIIGSIEGVQLHINPDGVLSHAGFSTGSGMSGRRLNVDTYGGLIPFGEHALSGKDPQKPERAGAYATRAAAKYLVDQGLVSSAVVTLAYTAGRAEPISIEAVGVTEKTRGSKLDLSELVKKEFDFRPEAIVKRFDLLRPIYRATSVYGHFGRAEFPWEM